MTSTSEFDYVVVGGGSAGCVVAGRLSESGAHKVALLEAGGSDDSFWIHAPLGFGKLYSDGRHAWVYQCEPEQELAGTGSIALRGKVLGGTGSINGLVYLRGQRENFDYWRQLGNVGWSYEDVLPYFKKSEDNDRGASEYHGVGGPLGIASLPRHELVDAFVAAGIQAGYPANSDFNGLTQEGFGFTQMTARKGRRCSTADAFIHPARNRASLKTILNAQVTRVLFEGLKAVGVEFRCGGETRKIMARREVILSAGAFNSPHILQLSGVGPASLLKNYNVPIVADVPGVGENLHDHFTAPMSYHCTKKITVNDIVSSPVRRILMGLQYVLFRKGLMATNANFGGGFIRTDPSFAVPNIRLHISLWSLSVLGRPKERMGLSPYSSFSVSIHLLNPDSRGTVHLKSADPLEHPAIHYNLFKSRHDHLCVVEAVRIVRRIMTQPAIASYVAEEVAPGPSNVSEEDIISFFRGCGRPNNHSSGTCKMGVDDKAVVDPRLRVRGLTGLRVMDASIMPQVVAANTNAATIMIGEKGAAMVLEDAL